MAAATLIVVTGSFFLFIGSMVLHWDSFFYEFDPSTGEDVLSIDPGPFLSGLICIMAYATSLFGAYMTLRLRSFPVAMLTMVFFVVAYLGMALDTGVLLVVFLHQLVLVLATLWLRIYARPLFAGPRTSEGLVHPTTNPFDGWGHR